MTTRMLWTRFADRAATSKREIAHDWPELAEHIRTSGPFAAKALCPWLKLATFGDIRSSKGALRNKSNVLSITGVEGDYDGEQMQPAEAVQLLERAGIRAIVYTSPSHTPERPRWRVLAPLSVVHEPVQRSALLSRVNGALGGVLTSESWRLAQSYYYGRVAGQAEYLVLSTFDDPDDGTCVDELDELDEIAIGAPGAVSDDEDGPANPDPLASACERLGRKLRTGDGRREILKSYIARKSNQGLSGDEIHTLTREAVARFFDAADPLDWSNVGELITHITEADAGQRARDAAVVGGFVGKLAEAPKAEPVGLPFLDLAALSEASASVCWSVKHLIPSDSIGVMFGGSGTFKSFIALDYALHVAHGLRWMGKKTKKGPVVYIAAEGGSGLWKRIKAWHQMQGLNWQDLAGQFYVVPVALDLLKKSGAVVEAAQQTGCTPAAVIVDTMSQTFNGEENSANEVAAYLGALGTAFRALWACVVLVIHHSGHTATERPRGSSAIRSNVDFMIGVFRDEKEMLATLTWAKQKDGETPADAAFGLSSQLLSHDEDNEPVTSLVASFMQDPAMVQAAKAAEMLAGRSGRNGQLLALVQNGMPEKELRKLFYDVVDVPEIEKKKVAFYRARDWAVKAGFIEVSQGTVLVLKEIN